MNEASPSFEIRQTASMAVRPAVLKRAEWDVVPNGNIIPQKGTWHAHIERRTPTDVTVIAFLGCPSCGNKIVLSQSKDAATILSKWFGRTMPVIHAIDRLGKVSPDVLCMNGSCDFHRTVYLDRWNQTKPLYAMAYTRGAHGRIEIAYTHATNQHEARLHLGAGNFRIIDIAPAIGFFVDEKTGRMTAD